ncbi:MAG: hypothetical protein B7Z66_03110 [Chromatiales bacterium 21-64-14]|nr:MAG: hypothetical protein B7Z66_03110 [Chromatiales bacterium 21-64-14]HQU15680.1 FAD-dependent oxidoreductase [Gammaproteobacteria bacterium]
MGPVEGPQNADVAIVGGGLAGLILARAGRRVALFEQGDTLGGRARTEVRGAFHFNLGPHALYLGGEHARMLRELGIRYPGGPPRAPGSALHAGTRFRLPRTPRQLLTSRLLSWRGRLEIARLFQTLPAMDTAILARVSLGEWLDTRFHHPTTRQLAAAYARLSTYSNDPCGLSAGAALDQMRLSQAAGVHYVDGGWRTLVASLAAAARAAGASIITGARILRVERDERGVRAVRGVEGWRCAAPSVILAAGPRAASEWVEDSAATPLPGWADAARPVYAACLDVGLRRLPAPTNTFALGIDQPLYYSVNSTAARLAPDGAALIHVAKYGSSAPDAGLDGAEAELEGVLDLLQPGWRELLVDRRYRRRMTVTHALVTAHQGGRGGRPGPAVPGVAGLYVCGDWVGPRGMLSDASVASARDAAALILAGRRPTDAGRTARHPDARAGSP